MAFVNYNSFFNTQKAKALKQDGSNYDAIDGDLVRFRCILPQPALTEKYSPRFIGGFLLIIYCKLYF